jgi:hypothetical protein
MVVLTLWGALVMVSVATTAFLFLMSGAATSTTTWLIGLTGLLRGLSSGVDRIFNRLSDIL